RHHYWSAKIDFAVIDELGRPIENPTVQIDVESGERFDIEYTDGTETHTPPILHYSPSGGIERVICGLLETAAKQEKPQLPTWLSPTQVRFIPVQEEHIEYCEQLVDQFEDHAIRADIDDRNESVGKRIAKAETDWVPYYIVVGSREIESGELGVNIREEEKEVTMRPEELTDRINDQIGDLPRKSRYLPKFVSNHPNFTGS
ncbi:MAG: His/Gly/Thr/Pro-type tRNA ligase C-terminal domain-containing protein, partial [Halobacteriaceae archaeon]